MAMLLIQSNTPGLLTLNGQFCGRVDDSPQSYLTHHSDRGYLFFTPFDDTRPSLTREIRIRDDQLLPPDEGIYALQWPEGVCQLELRPSQRPGDTAPAPGALPADALDVQKRPVFDGCTLLTFRTGSGECARLYDAAGLSIASLDARRLTWDTPEIVQAFEEAKDFVGHASLCSYRLTPAGFTALTRQNIWSAGAPRWPTTPMQTLRAYLEALCIGANAEAAHYLSAPDRHTALEPFDRVIDLRFPLTHAPEQLPLALGILTVLSPTLARVQAVCARTHAVSHAQGTHKIEALQVIS